MTAGQTPYLIIGGSTKCGTTSVFNYFEFHPQVCPSSMKESRFFWTGQYPLTGLAGRRETVRSFASLFKNCRDGSLRIEATPDYLYSSSSAGRIRTELPQCKMVFILRNPVTRLVSWYKFARLNGFIDGNMSLSTYIKDQLPPHDDAPQHMRSLEQGKYATYLATYLELFGRENVLVTFYEDLVADPCRFCQDIARFAGINENYFTGYDFRIFNKTVSAKSTGAHLLFRKFKRSVGRVARLFHPSIRKKLKLAGYRIEQLYQTANKKSASATVDLTPELVEFLDRYYLSDKEELNRLLGKKIPW